MHARPKGSAALVVFILLAGIAIAIANVGALLFFMKGTVELPNLSDFYRLCAPCLIYFVAVPLAAAILVAITAQRLSASAQRKPSGETPAAPPPAPPSPTPALRLLALLQQEGRLIDFLKEDIDGYSDSQIGAAVRSIHAGCRKALGERVELQRIFAAEDGSPVVVEPGFDPAAVRLTGNVTGAPPFRGTLLHGGWRAAKITLPPAPGDVDPTIIAPAEVEIP